jgi:hypothetical protein
MRKVGHIILICLSFISCEKEVELNLDDKNPNLPVFSGWITSAFSNQAIKIQTTSNFSTPSNPTYISSASILVENNGVNYTYHYNPSTHQHEPTSSFVLEEGHSKVQIKIDGKSYEHEAEIYSPIFMNEIFAYCEIDTLGAPTGLLVQFDMPTENNYAILFELLVDSSGMGINYESLTPTILDMALIQNYLDEYNTYGDIVIFQDLLNIDNGQIVYKLISHRISTEQYQYILRFQKEYDGNLYSPQPNNMPTIFSNNGLGIVLLSADSFIEFTF